jgi:predicted esterase
MRALRILQLPVLMVVLLAATACQQPFNDTGTAHDGGADSGPTGAGVGGVCRINDDCRTGLTCTQERCQPPGDKVPGSTCILSGECLPGNYCAMGVCHASGMMGEDGTCSGEGDCASGLVCNGGVPGKCHKPGLGDLGAACTETAGCFAGLVCASGACQTPTTMPPAMGGPCGDAPQEATARVLFHVPRAGETSADFYRLPFPNDIRLKNGKVSLAGHPTAGTSIFLPYDIVDRYLRAIEAEMTGFSVNPVAYFRFSRDPKFETVGMPDAVVAYNITPGSPQYGQPIFPGWYVSNGGLKYICPRWLAVRHNFGAPLRPGETYAYVVRNIITDAQGTAMAQDDDFKVMLGAGMPADPDLAAAWKAYAPLRAWIGDKKFDAARIAAAAVFTTDKPEQPLAKMREAVRAAPAPVIKGFVKCADGVKSPCEDNKTGAQHERGCMGTSPAFDEYQGTVSVPIFQKGTPPYDQPADGGGISLDASGAAQVQRTEDVCFSLTVPHGAAPASGWPVVVYSHGTGGSYRSAIDSGLAADYAQGAVDGGAAVPMATFGYDGVLHGPRKGTSTKAVTELVYNFQNPLAARDNAVQAAGDLFAVARAVESFATGGIKLDPAKVALYGHSQGGNAAANAVGLEPRFGAAVLSGTGGTLVLSLLGKKQPVNIAAVVPVVLGEAKADANHPVLNLLQMYLDRSDSVNYAPRIFADPPAGVPPRHALMIFGTGDTYAPVETQRTFARAAGFPLVGTVLDPDDLKEVADGHRAGPIASPAKGNYMTTSGASVTAVESQYNPSGYDGHFVSTENPSARKAIQGFLGTFMRDGVPTVQP